MAFTYDTKLKIAASTSNPVTGSYTCGTSAKLLVVTLAYAYGTRTGAPTYNGADLVQVDQVRNHSASPEACAELWYLPTPLPVGSPYTISVPNPNGLSLEVVVSSYNTATGYGAILHKSAGGNNASANPSVSITPTVANCLIIAVVATGDDGWAPTARGGTQLYDTDNGTWGAGHQYFIQTTAAAKAMSWTDATSDDWGECVAAFAEVRTGESVSKLNVYSVLGPPEGISVSKLNVYSVLAPPTGISVSKLNVYSVLEVPDLRVTKANVYSVLTPPEGISVSKAVIYSVVGRPLTISKAIVYSVLHPTIQYADVSIYQAVSATAILGHPSGSSVTGTTTVLAAIESTAIQGSASGEYFLGDVSVTADVSCEVTAYSSQVAYVAVKATVESEVDSTTFVEISQVVREVTGRFPDNLDLSQITRTPILSASSEAPISQVTRANIFHAHENAEISQVTYTPIFHANEHVAVSQITRTAIIRKKKPDYWPILNRLVAMQQKIGKHV